MLNSADGVTFPGPAAPPHEHDAPDPIGDVGREVQRQRDVRQRADGAEGDGAAGPLAQQFDDRFDRVTVRQRGGWVRQTGAVESRLSVHMLRRDRRPQQRAVAAGVDRHIRASCELDDPACVRGGQFERYVP